MRMPGGLLCTGKKRRSSKTTKSNDKNDEIFVVSNNNNNNVDIGLNDDEQSLQNGHCGVTIENNDETDDIVSDLPLYGRRPSRTKMPSGDNSNNKLLKYW